MNRLILVGNGFDLAHGLKSGYRDFIDDFWTHKTVELLSFIKLNNQELYSDSFITVSNCNRFPKHISFNDFESLKIELDFYVVKLTFENSFLEIISSKRSLQNWVDIEKEYYNQLYEVKAGTSVDNLNKEFEEIKNLFIEYLCQLDKYVEFNKNFFSLLLSSFQLRDMVEYYKKYVINEVIEFGENCKNGSENGETSLTTTDFLNSLNDITDISKKEIFVVENFDNLDVNKNEIFHFFPQETLLVNFNYTNTTDCYVNKFQTVLNFDEFKISKVNIHGDLANEDNPIIFGFGDDVDEKYKDFENLDDNRFLKNFKSIAYLQSDNYKRILEFINVTEYQVFIFGHSCGISDRTMLNTIFEHDNCKSVKPFYHKRQDGSDNYTDIVQNISRNFNDKKKFRDRVVNKTYCEPLT